MTTDLGSGKRSCRKRIGKVETVGVVPVPEDKRTLAANRLFIIWLMASASKPLSHMRSAAPGEHDG
jgi:hypothetical protein